MNLCPGFTYCGIKEKRQEYIAETNQVKISIKKTKDKIQNLENQLNSIKDFETQSEHQFIKNLKPRLIAMNKSYEQNKVLLMRHLRLLRTELKGKIPPVTCHDAEHLQILLKKCTTKMQQNIGDEYDELIASTSGINSNNTSIASNPNCTTSVKANSKNNVNIFTGNISPVQPMKQVAERDVVKQVKSGAITQDSLSETESSSDEKQSRKRKKQKRRKKKKKYLG